MFQRLKSTSLSSNVFKILKDSSARSGYSFAHFSKRNQFFHLQINESKSIINPNNFRFYSTQDPKKFDLEDTTSPEEKLKQINFDRMKVPPLDGQPETRADAKILKLVDDISSLSMVEQFIFMRALAEKLGVPFESLISMGSVGGGGPVQAAQPTAAAAPKEEKKEAPPKTAFTVKLTQMDDGAKYKVLKEIRDLKPGMNIAESKKYIEGLPKVLVEGVSKEVAEKWAEKLKAVGGVVEIE